MAHIQKEPEFRPKTYCGGAGDPALPGEPTGPGGHMQLVNQNEREISEQSWEMLTCDYQGYQDNFDHVQGVYREGSIK